MPRTHPNKHRYPVVKDAFGDDWYVWERVSGAGIDWLRGWPVVLSFPSAPIWIITPEARAFLESNTRHGVMPTLDLPFGRWVRDRMRRTLGITPEDWWHERESDLFALSPTEFSKRHSVGKRTAAEWRKRIGATSMQYDDAWYVNDPELRALLVSDLPVQLLCEFFARSAKHITNLRSKLRTQGVTISDQRGRTLSAEHWQAAKENLIRARAARLQAVARDHGAETDAT